MSEKEIRLIDANGLIQTLAIVAKKMAKSDAQKALMGRVLYIVEHKPTLYPLWNDAKTDPPNEPGMVFSIRTRRSGTTRWKIWLSAHSASVEGTRVARPS